MTSVVEVKDVKSLLRIFSDFKEYSNVFWTTLVSQLKVFDIRFPVVKLLILVIVIMILFTEIITILFTIY